MNNNEKLTQKIDDSLNDHLNNMNHDKLVDYASNLTKENMLLKKIIFKLYENKNFKILKSDSDADKIKTWKIIFKNDNDEIIDDISIFFPTKLIKMFEKSK